MGYLIRLGLTGISKMRTLANSEDPDELPHHAAVHHGLHCLLRQKQSSKKKKLEMLTCDPSISTMYHPKFILSI